MPENSHAFLDSLFDFFSSLAQATPLLFRLTWIPIVSQSRLLFNLKHVSEPFVIQYGTPVVCGDLEHIHTMSEVKDIPIPIDDQVSMVEVRKLHSEQTFPQYPSI